MGRRILLLVATCALGACSTSEGARYSVTPETQVVLKGGTRKAAQANYRVTPEEATRAGAAGGGAGP